MSDPRLQIDRDDQLIVDGRLIGRFHRYEATPPSAEHFLVAVSASDAADAVVEHLPGWNVTTEDDDLAQALMARDAASSRHYSVLTLAVASSSDSSGLAAGSEPGGSPGALAGALAGGLAGGEWDALQTAPLHPDSEVTSQLVELIRRAYPLGHPDEEIGSDDDITGDLRRALNGSRLGPLMPQSCVVLDAGRPVALALVNRVTGVPPTGGPWLTDICRDPDPKYRGLGRALLVEVINGCRSDDESALSLAVTEGNPARQMYDDLGFQWVTTTRKLRLPG